MPKKLLLINAISIAIAAGSVVWIVRQLLAPMTMPLPGRARPPAVESEGPRESVRAPASAYTVVASKNMFSLTRSEAPVSPMPPAAPNLSKPNLFGVVLREDAPIAYLEDPATKRVSGYRVGDAVAGGTVQEITADSVSIAWPEGKVDVRLLDRAKSRPAVPQPSQIPAAPIGPDRRPLPPNLLRHLPRLPPADASQQ